jgi:hypothetical protein
MKVCAAPLDISRRIDETTTAPQCRSTHFDGRAAYFLFHLSILALLSVCVCCAVTNENSVLTRHRYISPALFTRNGPKYPI